MENTADKLRIIYGDVTLGIKGEDFHYIFNYARGGLESLVKKGKEWMYRVPVPAFWRATTDNDRNNQFSYQSAMWMAADKFPKCIGCEVKVNGKLIRLPSAPENNKYDSKQWADNIEVTFTFQTNTIPSIHVIISYHVEHNGRIKITLHYEGNENLPELPLLGIRFTMPTKADGYEYTGLSGETYPDRMAGGIPGTYNVEGLPVTRYLVPQDCGVHMETSKLTVFRNTTLNNASEGGEEFMLTFEKDENKFAFSCLPYTPFELENATHMEELPPARRTVLTILAKVRGVGGIDSWGSNVEEAYRISAKQDITFSFYMM